ncbi:MAG TPA: cobyric acid synthase [Thermoleophilaceae bacterium]|nr:cobyric acid synthase [Thermoleophilaceae bacterium]
MTALMVQGTSSSAGKSLIATALCRHFARRGVRVAPFKGQNMSNNARVVAGGEIGTAQYLQALAARAEPDLRMNPVLVKPEADMRSQVVVGGAVDHELSARPWRERAPDLWPAIAESLASLLEDYQLVVMEGAGSPAEINLADCDMTNLRAAAAADAPVLLVCDIDRGGAFAHLYGTWALLASEDRERVAGFVLNKFRGDPALLAGAPERLTELTGVPLAGVVPWLDHGLPDEDGVTEPRREAVAVLAPGARSAGTQPTAAARPVVAVIAYPTASNLDELRPLEQVAELRFTRRPIDLDGADLVVLPGSKHVAADLSWLRAAGFAERLRSRVCAGGRVLGICGGLQMLGRELRDPVGVDGDASGLGLLPLITTFEREKLVRRGEIRLSPALPEPWAALGGLELGGYEIRHGRTVATDPVKKVLPDGRGWARGSVLGVTIHGLLESPAVVAALLGEAPPRSLDTAIDELTDGVMAALDVEHVERLAGVGAWR